jgi:putative ABC transport system permease protein
VRGAAAINVLPLTGQSNLPTQRVGDPAKSIGGMEVRLVTPEYFAEMGIAIRSGRGFNRSDTAGALPVALVNERVARDWWPDGRAIGDRLRVGMFRGREFPEILDTMREVVGVVADTKSVTLQDRPRPTVYIPVFQAGVLARVNGELSWIVRTSAETGGIAAALRQAIASADPEQRVLRMRPMEQIVASTTAGSRFHAWLFGLFAGIAVALAAIGVYGLLSFSVAQRRHEIGTRMALGAGRWDVLVLVLRQGLALTAIGLALGVTGALFLTRLLSKLLWGVQPNDPLSFAAVAVVLVMADALASYLPARRASRIDPMAALRYD